MKRKKIAVIFGGKSTEYSISLKSAYSVLSNIDINRFDIYMIGINQKGQWKHFTGSIELIKENKWETDEMNTVYICPDPTKRSLMEIINHKIVYIEIDALFPVMHGKNGEDGTLQGLIEMSGIHLIGCSTLSSALCMDKYRAHELVKNFGIKVPNTNYLASKKQYAKKKADILNMELPLFIKPVHSGSSYGISCIETFNQLDKAVNEAFTYDNEVIIEEKINGFEVGCAIFGKNELKVGRVDEIELTADFFDFEEKYTLKTSKIHMPARISPDLEKKIQETAKQIYSILGCQIFARVDMFLTKDNEIIFNEVNTIPGFTTHSRYPKMMNGIGISFTDLITQLIEMGFDDENNQIR